jgi:16S rRNA (guanine966-N2)-methyltransferase
LRIISGSHKGRVLQVDKRFSDRPTTDFAKESLFNILYNRFDFEELRVLDLFAGSGGISYEFASRGVKSIETVDSNANYIEFIKEQCKKIGFTQVKCIRADAFKYIEKCGQQYDIVFADPPYIMDGVNKLPALVFQFDLLKTDGLFILEHSKRFKFADVEHFTEERTYGNVHFSIFR